MSPSFRILKLKFVQTLMLILIICLNGCRLIVWLLLIVNVIYAISLLVNQVLIVGFKEIRLSVNFLA